VVLATFFFVPHRARWVWLLAASFYFYGSYNPLVLAQLLLSIGVTYWLSLRIEAETEPTRKKRWLKTSIGLLVANLFAFKYTAFVNESVRSAFELAGLTYPVPEFHILLPLGISFYTFQLIGYVVDVSRGTKAERHLGIFALFVMFFPKLVSGPIERGKGLLPQLHTEQFFDSARVASGLRLMLWGLFKKVVVADQLAMTIQAAYDKPHEHSGVVMIFATWLFAFQVYCDFSGYTDIALGAAETLGYKLSPNFNRPYFATSVGDFWKRWHMSLSNWLTDYVYNPLTKTKVSMKWFYWMLCSLFITFVISGFWHGAAWTFVLWGALHGTYLVLAIMTQKQWRKVHERLGLLKRQRLHLRLKIASTFCLVSLAYVFFRSNTTADAFYILTHFHTGWTEPFSGLKELVRDNRTGLILGLCGAAVVMAVDWFEAKTTVAQVLAARPRWVRLAVYYAGAVAILLFGALSGPRPQFIYVRF
jgi:D-alanyl-lipoteichoic acid acyltransferase DltB (MBOAT superfamily)